MKKLFTVIAVLIMAAGISINAQRAGEFNLANTGDNWSKSGIFAEIGAGAACGDIESDLGISVGLGYRYHFGNGFNWDVVKATFYNAFTTRAFEEGCAMRFLTGFRYNSAPVLADKPIYGTFSAGYQLNVYDTDYFKGFAYELGFGVLLSPTASLGIVWEGNVAHSYWGNENFGIVGLKLGLQF